MRPFCSVRRGYSRASHARAGANGTQVPHTPLAEVTFGHVAVGQLPWRRRRCEGKLCRPMVAAVAGAWPERCHVLSPMFWRQALSGRGLRKVKFCHPVSDGQRLWGSGFLLAFLEVASSPANPTPGTRGDRVLATGAGSREPNLPERPGRRRRKHRCHRAERRGSLPARAAWKPQAQDKVGARFKVSGAEPE